MYGQSELVALAGYSAEKQLGQEFDQRRMASKRFWRLFAGGFWGRARRLLGQQRSELMSLKQATQGMILEGSRQLGTATVPVEQIKGSEGKCSDFDREFRPLKVFIRERWTSLAAAYLRGVTLPPVELIKVGDGYFVRDGHHRISVARAFGQMDIDAVVTIWEVEAAE